MALSSVPATSRLSPSSDSSENKQLTTTVYGSRFAKEGIPRFEMGEEEMSAVLAARFVKDELLMDSNPSLNLASFVTTFMEPEVEAIMMENMNKNHIDVEEYPGAAELETRCVSIIARMFNAPLHSESEEALGVSTIGSSEAIILAVLAAKRRWQNKRRLEGKSTEKPNLVMSSAVQVCWEKAARYLDVEERYWFCSTGKYILDPDEAVALVDENTILVCAILGSTYTGQYEDVAGLNDKLLAHNKAKGLDVYIHVDAASGGFVAPFVNPSLIWDFRLPLVCSINTSGHKYGLCYAGVGWAIWRGKDWLPDEILFTVNYLGAPQVSFTLNFSKSSLGVIAQYYQLLRLGKSGYRAIMTNLTSISDKLAEGIVGIQEGNLFEIMSDGEGKGLPLVAWKLKKEGKFDEFAIASHLKQRGWVVPAYTMAPHTEQLKLLRVVVREDFSESRAQTFLRDLNEAVEYLEKAPESYAAHLSAQRTQGAKSQHHPAHAKNTTRVHLHDKHSLAKTGKTHAVC